MGGKGKKKSQSGKKTGRKKSKGSAFNFGGLAGLISPAIQKEAGKAFREILPNLLAFPTSGASAMASPNLALGGYNSSMSLSAPAANGTYVKHTKAKMRNSKSGMNVRHREYIQDIVFGEAGDFENVVASPINPGNSLMFPWLSAIATRFETFSFKYLRFIYEPQCGTENEGTVMIAVDFDAVDAPPVDKLQFMTYDGAVRSPPWFASVYACAGYNLHKYKQYYITKDLITPLSTDEKTYFVGNLFVATQSQADPFTAGELYVEYEVELQTPQLSEIGSIAGYVEQNGRFVDGTYSDPAYEAGELDVMKTLDTPNSTLDGTYLLPRPGSFIVIAYAQAQNDVGNIAIGFYNNIPPPGISVASELQLFLEDSSPGGFAVAIFAIANLVDPVWFRLQSGFAGMTGNATLGLCILPLDAAIMQVFGPFMAPPLNATATRMERFLKMRAVSHKAKQRTRLPPRMLLEAKPVAKTTVEEVDKNGNVLQTLVSKKMSFTKPTVVKQ